MNMKYEIDMLTDESVSIKTMKTTVVDSVEYVIGEVHRKAYDKSEGWKEMLQKEIPEPCLSAILVRWETGDRVALSTSEVAEEEDLLLALPTKHFLPFNNNSHTYLVGDMFLHFGIKYKVVKEIITNENVRPETVGAREWFMPYQGNYRVRWAYKEPIKQGYTREYEGKWYIAKNNISSDNNTSVPANSSDLWVLEV